jgi:hypothetical protein
MITKKEEYILEVALTSERMASEIASRVISMTPPSAAAAQSILDVIDSNKKEEKDIQEYLTVACASQSVGEEIKGQLDLVVECLEYQAADSVANNAALAAAQSKIKLLSKKVEEYLIVSCANESIAKSIVGKINASGQYASAIVPAV